METGLPHTHDILSSSIIFNKVELISIHAIDNNLSHSQLLRLSTITLVAKRVNYFNYAAADDEFVTLPNALD